MIHAHTHTQILEGSTPETISFIQAHLLQFQQQGELLVVKC